MDNTKTNLQSEVNPEEFLDRGLADVQDEGGILTYYSKEAVLECITAALASRKEAPATPQADQYTTVYNAWALMKSERYSEAFAVLSKLVGYESLTQPTTVQQAETQPVICNWPGCAVHHPCTKACQRDEGSAS